MLPMINLQAGELLSFDATQGAPSLVPEGADSLEAGFSDILHQGAIMPAAGGDDLPTTGKDLPLLPVSGEFIGDRGPELLARELTPGSVGLAEPVSTKSELAGHVIPGLPLAVDLRQASIGSPQMGANLSELQPADGKGWQPPVMLPPSDEVLASRVSGALTAVPGATGDAAHDGTLTAFRAGELKDLMPERGGERALPAQMQLNPVEVRTPAQAAKGAEIAALSLEPVRSPLQAAEPEAALRMPLEDVQIPVKPVAANVGQTATPVVDASLIGPTAGRFTVDMPAPAVQQAVSQSIQLPVQESGWDHAIAERVVMMANGKLQNAEIRLTPADLGPLRIQVSVDDGAAHVSFQAQHALTREAIEQAMPRLRELLADQGLSLGQANVSEEGTRQGVREEARDGRSTALAGGDTELEGEEPEAPPTHQRVSNGLLDTFV